MCVSERGFQVLGSQILSNHTLYLSYNRSQTYFQVVGISSQRPTFQSCRMVINSNLKNQDAQANREKTRRTNRKRKASAALDEPAIRQMSDLEASKTKVQPTQVPETQTQHYCLSGHHMRWMFRMVTVAEGIVRVCIAVLSALRKYIISIIWNLDCMYQGEPIRIGKCRIQ